MIGRSRVENGLRVRPWKSATPFEARHAHQVVARLERARGPQLDGDAGEHRVRELESPA